MSGIVCIIGNFDGVHLGHRMLISKALEIASVKCMSAHLVTLYPHPQSFFNPGSYKSIYCQKKKEKIVTSLGLDSMIVLPFDQNFLSQAPQEFVERYLIEKLNCKALVTGEDFRFGKDREGDAAFLSKIAQSYDFEYFPIAKIQTADGVKISTTLIKECLQNGRVSKAAALLGKNYEISGTVIKGQEIAGKSLCFATANIAIRDDAALPLFGVYFVKIRVGHFDGYGVANLGIRPTFNLNTPLLEVHIFDFKNDIYGQELEVQFIALLRPERKFNGLDELKAQIATDVQSASYLMRNIKKVVQDIKYPLSIAL